MKKRTCDVNEAVRRVDASKDVVSAFPESQGIAQRALDVDAEIFSGERAVTVVSGALAAGRTADDIRSLADVRVGDPDRLEAALLEER